MLARSHARRIVAVSAVVGLLVAGATGPGLAATAVPAPIIGSLSAISGPTAGHVKLTVHGSGFTSVARVMFGGAKAGAVTVLSSHTLTLTVPAHKGARLDVRVVTTHGTSAVTGHDKFTYVAPPVVKSLSLASSLVTGGGRLAVHGSGFLHVHSVRFGVIAGTKLHVISSTSLAVNVPAHLAGTVDVRVVTAYGTSAVKAVDKVSFVAPLPMLSAPTLPVAERGVHFITTLAAPQGGTAPFTWAVTGLPGGLTASTAGVISGTTYAGGSAWPLTVMATDALGHVATAAATLEVKAHPGQVLGWGDNSLYEQGNGTTTGPVTTPAAITGLTGVIQVVGGSEAGFALRSDGTVYAWGSNTYGELGLGDTTRRATPVQVPGLFGVTSLAAGQYTTYAVKSDGTVLAWGLNADGEVGDGTVVNRPSPTPVAGLTDVTSIAAGSATAFALRADGTVWSWGSNLFGELGVGSAVASSPTASPIPGLAGAIEVSAKIYNGEALLANGTVMAWGYNVTGEVGDVTTTNRSAPVAVLGLTGVTEIANADYNTYVLMADGTVRAWGQNDQGQLGDGSLITRLSPVTLAGLSHVVSIGAGAYTGYAEQVDGSVYAWGENTYGDVGNGTVIEQNSPQLIPSLFAAVAIGPGHLAQYAVH